MLIEESVLGWKEYELEVIRDATDNFIVVCSIENIDPMGVHTGDSITVAPAMTLTDREYQRLRDAARAVMTEIGVETGGSNVQFAVSPNDGRVLVIEMNPRVSRSSALASKATGYPIAKIAAKLAVGYTLDELKNDITGTSAAFEPAIDYVVVKWPRFAFEKFPGADSTLGTQMKSVGEVMSIGRTFCEALQKAARSLETGKDGLGSLLDKVDYRVLAEPKRAPRSRSWRRPSSSRRRACRRRRPEETKRALLDARRRSPSAERLFYVVDAMRVGVSDEQIHDITKIDPWFLAQLRRIVDAEAQHRRRRALATRRSREYKRLGFSDRQIAKLAGSDEDEVRAKRKAAGIRAVYARVDTCAAEFPAKTPYLYSCIRVRERGQDREQARRSSSSAAGRTASGRASSSTTAACTPSRRCASSGIETIMVNCNPETVSTDYDTSDRLYFEPLTLEDVLAICDEEKPDGRHRAVRRADAAEARRAAREARHQAPRHERRRDRPRRGSRAVRRSSSRSSGSSGPRSGIARDRGRGDGIAEGIGYPVLVRPSYVLGGRAMMIAYTRAELETYVQQSPSRSRRTPARPTILVDEFLKDAIEVDVDCVCDGKRAVIGGVMQHIEEAGIHSGDSTSVLPPYSLLAGDRPLDRGADAHARARARRRRAS